MNRFELSFRGEVLSRPEAGFEKIFEADIPAKDENIVDRINAAILRYRRHGSTVDDRRQAVRDLADVLEYLRPGVRELLTNKDESDLFNYREQFRNSASQRQAADKLRHSTLAQLDVLFLFGDHTCGP